MTRSAIDCRDVPNEKGCTLRISGEPDEVLTAAVEHAARIHGHNESRELREELRDGMRDDVPSHAGAFVQLIEFTTDHPEEWQAITSRWADAIGTGRTTRWGLLGADHDESGRYVAIIEFPDYGAAMTNSAHPATKTFLEDFKRICTSEPRFRNLSIDSATPF